MKNLKTKIILGFNVGVLVPTIIYFFSLWFYGFMSTEQLILSFTTLRLWMLFVIVYFPLMNTYLIRKLKFLSNYLEYPKQDELGKAQKIVSQLPKMFIYHVMIYATSGASSLVLVENFFTVSEKIMGIALGFAFTFVYALPFFVGTVILIEKWTSSIPISENHKFLSVKGKLYINLLCNAFGVGIVIIMLNLGVVMSSFGLVDFETLFQTMITKNIVIGILCLIIVVINLKMLSKQLISPIEDTTEMFKVISEGDLSKTIDISSKDEIGILKHWCDLFVDKIHDVIVRIRLGANHLDSSAERLVLNIDNITSAMTEMGDAANKIAISAEDTCETIAEVTNSLNVMDASILKIVDNSMSASNQSNKTVDISKQGKEIVTDTIHEMDYIHEEMIKLVKTIEHMGESVIQIEKIVNMISGIARQTNMLAINASIEAARAGEHGLGFGVVADSISQLSEESNLSAKEITKLVEDIQEIAIRSVETTKTSLEKVEAGVELVKKTGTAFDEIYEAINSTTNMVNEIATATDKQANESKAIMTSINNLNEMSLHVSALVQEQVAATEEVVSTLHKVNSSSSESTTQKLALESKELYRLISQFKVDEE
ncbi:MAG: methyl-accepting chemotaxis protein [Halanaerobiales bacterium]|nr:methyl-accepting chemotaxis protein [Halanaerobiales bacterium]